MVIWLGSFSRFNIHSNSKLNCLYITHINCEVSRLLDISWRDGEIVVFILFAIWDCFCLLLYIQSSAGEKYGPWWWKMGRFDFISTEEWHIANCETGNLAYECDRGDWQNVIYLVLIEVEGRSGLEIIYKLSDHPNDGLKRTVLEQWDAWS